MQKTSFLVQDAAQGYHWHNSQCTLHPFVFYYKDSDSKLQHQSFCFISDGTKHSTAMVYTFLNELIPLLRSRFPTLKKLIYFTDGCAGQYKNRFNFINLSFHKDDFGVTAEWNFFATSHGKNACDGIGGTLKRCVAKASLQRVINDQITTPMDFFNYCKEKIPSIHCIFTKKQDVESTAVKLEARFAEAITIQGTQKHHHFKPLDDGFIEIAELSNVSSTRKRVKIRKTTVPSTVPIQADHAEDYVGSYVVVEEGSKMWVAFVDHQDKEFGDYHIKFLHPAGIRPSYAFPSNEREQCFKSAEQIIGVLPQPTYGTRMRYSFPKERLQALMRGGQ